MKQSLAHFFASYGMIFVLILLCGVFSVVTYSEQSLSGEAAAKQLAPELRTQPGKGGQVLIAVRAQADDALFARKLEGELAVAGIRVVSTVSGEPKDAREMLEK